MKSWTLGVIGMLMASLCQGAPLKVVSTTTMLTDLVQVVGGEDVEVKGLMGPGVDPHLYKAASSDLLHLSKADVVIYNGLYLEGKMSEILERMNHRGKKVHAVGPVIPDDVLLHPEDFEGHPDPHVWGDVTLWIQCVDAVAGWLDEAAPDQAAAFKKRAEAYKKELEDLDAWVQARVESVPKEDRVLFTSHDAFNYFGRAYGFDVVGVQGISTVTEAGLGDVSMSIKFIKARGIKALFAESSVSPVTIERISKDSGAVIGGELYSDAMGTPGEVVHLHGESYDKGTYIGMIKHNVNTIVDALSGEEHQGHER